MPSRSRTYLGTSGQPAQLMALRTLRLGLLAIIILPGCFSHTVPFAKHHYGDVALLVTHSPMHPRSDERVTINAHVGVPVSKIEISYGSENLSLGRDGTILQTSAEPMRVATHCTFPNGRTESKCSFSTPMPFPDSTLVEVLVKAYVHNGVILEDSYRFAAGAYPIPDAPIPVRFKGGADKRLDVVIVPESKTGTIRDKIDKVIEKGYFKYRNFLTWRGYFNFYYSDYPADYPSPCQFEGPSNYYKISWADAVVVAHAESSQDCTVGNRISTEIDDSEKSLGHETGHVLFGLQDEYCAGDTSYEPQSCHANIWDSLKKCQDAARLISTDASKCTQLLEPEKTCDNWRIDSIGDRGCVMGIDKTKPNSDFGVACSKRMEWRYSQCRSGRCYSETLKDCP